MKRRAKRAREKQGKQTMESTGGWDDFAEDEQEPDGDAENEADDDDDQQAAAAPSSSSASGVIFSDEVEYVGAVRCNSKIKGFRFSPASLAVASGSKRAVDINDSSTNTGMVTLTNNSVELYSLTYAMEGSTLSLQTAKASILDLHGHRSDIRAVALSSDNTTIATCSNEGIKLWSTKSQNCIRSCPSGYGVSVAFAPGSRYVINGTKDGHVKIIDTTSGNLVVDENAHPDSAVWAIAVRPDGKGFMTGSTDKLVKFWDFSVVGGNISAQLTRQLQMTSEVLCLRYSPTKQQDKVRLFIITYNP
jgi:U3 small nucleolar RNA-associated protein 12